MMRPRELRCKSRSEGSWMQLRGKGVYKAGVFLALVFLAGLSAYTFPWSILDSFHVANALNPQRMLAQREVQLTGQGQPINEQVSDVLPGEVAGRTSVKQEQPVDVAQSRFDVVASESEPKHNKRCVSIAYNKPAKTGSTAVGKILQQKFPDAKRVDCGIHSEHTSLEKLQLPENAEYDIFDCHSIWNATMIVSLAEQAKHRIVRVTTIRDPVAQLVSLYFHVKHNVVCGSGTVPKAAEMVKFAKQVYHPRVESFYSRPYTVEQLSENLARAECAFWDVIWSTDELEEVLGSTTHFNSGKAECPERDAMLGDPEVLQALAKATEGSRAMYEGLQKCDNVRRDVPWAWDADKGCIAEV